MGSERYEVRATDAFAEDLDAAVSYYLMQSGPKSAERFMSSYESFVRLLAGVPGHGAQIEGTQLRWRKVGVFIAVYDIGEETGIVTLLRLYYVSSNWRLRALRLKAEP